MRVRDFWGITGFIFSPLLSLSLLSLFCIVHAKMNLAQNSYLSYDNVRCTAALRDGRATLNWGYSRRQNEILELRNRGRDNGTLTMDESLKWNWKHMKSVFLPKCFYLNLLATSCQGLLGRRGVREQSRMNEEIEITFSILAQTFPVYTMTFR